MPAVDKDNGPYNVMHGVDPYMYDAFQSISSHTCYTKCSFEEIRLLDYNAGRYCASRYMKHGYVTAKVNAGACLGSLSPQKKVPSGGTQRFGYQEASLAILILTSS